MFSAFKRLQQVTKDVILSVDVERVGVIAISDTAVSAEIEIGQIKLNTKEHRLRLKTSKREEQMLEAMPNKSLRMLKQFSFYNRKPEKSTCKITVHAKRGSAHWLTMTQYYDFEAFAAKEN